MLMGDLLAYIDIFSMIFLLGILSRATTILFVIKQGAASALRLARSVLARVHRLDTLDLAISSSEIRTRLAAGDAELDVPTAVLDYIRERNLYSPQM